MKQGEIYYADLSPTVGSEQGGIRPVLILQNDKGNLYSPTTIVAILTTKKKANLPTHVYLKSSVENGLPKNSIVELEQIRTIDRSRIGDKIGYINAIDRGRIFKAIKISIGL